MTAAELHLVRMGLRLTAVDVGRMAGVEPIEVLAAEDGRAHPLKVRRVREALELKLRASAERWQDALLPGLPAIFVARVFGYEPVQA